MMTRKHFTAIAEILGDALADGHDSDTVAALTHDLAELFASENPRFDRSRFTEAVNNRAETIGDLLNLSTDFEPVPVPEALTTAHGPWGIDPAGA